MPHIASLRYAPPRSVVPVTAWGRDWRRRWFRQVGSLHEHHATAELVAFYSDDRPAAARLALQAELEARPCGVAEVLAACREDIRIFEARYAAPAAHHAPH